ncbi:MAG: hypothetical protein QOE61_4338 [Micromonosporaceae bacterium]|nr:hypothetical protein [Micromonosporaceae bacterium]
MMATYTELGAVVTRREAAGLTGVSRATAHRHDTAAEPTPSSARPAPANRLDAGERARILAEHSCGEVHAYRASSDGGAGSLACGLARATADVEHTVMGADAGSGAEEFVVQAQLCVVVEQVGVPGSVLTRGRLGLRLRLGTVLVGHHRHRILSIAISTCLSVMNADVDMTGGPAAHTCTPDR